MMLKKILSGIVFVTFLILLLLGFALKDRINKYSSNLLKLQANPDINLKLSGHIDSLYNYSNNNFPYEITFLEFGSTGCSACKQMERVMQDVKSNYNKINVVFYNVSLPENYDLIKYYGIVTIPTQVLLDKNGKEFFRHSGFISANDMELNFKDFLKEF